MDLFQRNRKRDAAELETPKAKKRKSSNVRVGFLPLHDPDPQTVKADIIFIHGLTGDREKTWTDKESSTFWPQDLLPAMIARARILTFGYDADVADWRAMVSKNRIGEHAKTFLSELASHRYLDGTNSRPIFFVAHSLGGLVCQDTLLSSKNSANDREKAIVECTRGIAFIGTPHSGSGFATWAARLAEATALVKQTNPKILEILKNDSEVLARIQQDFHMMIKDRARPSERKAEIEIMCFFEEVPLPIINELASLFAPFS